jgi:hypothetical protein
MIKSDYFIKALKAGLYKRTAWVISCFAIISEPMDNWKKDPFHYRLVPTQTGYFYVEVPEHGEPYLEKIDDGVPGAPLFRYLEELVLEANDLPNLDHDVMTTYGNAFFNMSCLCYPFGNKVPYMNGEVKPGFLQDYMAARIEDTPFEEDGMTVVPVEKRDPTIIYVDEYIKFVDAVYHLTNYSQTCIWAATPKTVLAPPGIEEYRASLIEKYKDRLHDPVAVAEISAALVEYDAAYLKGDPGEKFLLSDKSRRVVRAKQHLMHGAETSLNEGVGVQLIQNSLSEGWDISKFPVMNDSLRAGSFNRGAQTELGGESVKWLLRASSNIAVTQEDCGSVIGKDVVLDKDNSKRFVGFTAIVNGEQELLKDQETADKYLGQAIMIRSPMYCQLDKTDYCKVCIGQKLGENPTGLSLAISEYGSAFLGIFMSAMHGKALVLAKMDLDTALT